MEKKLIPFDDTNSYGTIGYGYTNKKEFAKDYKKITGEQLSREDYIDLQFVKVIKGIKNDEDYYFWGDKCPHCGSENRGADSILDIH